MDHHGTHRPAPQPAVNTHYQRMLPRACQQQGQPAAGATSVWEYVVEKDKWSSLSIMKRDGTGDSRVEWPALSLGTMAKSQAELPLSAMTESVATQCMGHCQ